MPIYEYRCPSCGHEFEKIVRVSQDNPACPKCDTGTEKKISLSAFHLKGGGWYADGYGSKSGSTSSGDSDSSSSTSSESTTSSPSSDSGSSSSSSESSTSTASSTPAKASSTSSTSPSAD